LTLDPDNCAACDIPLSNLPIVVTRTARLVRCDSCGSWTSFPRPTAKAHAAIHDTDEYFDHPYFLARRKLNVEHVRRCCEVFALINSILDETSLIGQRLLDIGCDTGSFLIDAAKCHKTVPFGLDVSSRAVQIAGARGLRVHHGTVDDAPSEFAEFKVVTAIDVIEHVVNAELFLNHVRDRMAAGGVLYLQTPNIDASVYQVGWRIGRLTDARRRNLFTRLFPSQHLQYFSHRGLVSLAQKCGFEVPKMETKPFPGTDIIGEKLLFTLVTAAQFLDSFSRNRTLIRALLQKPA